MKRRGRVLAIFVAAVLVPAIVLAVLGFSSVRAEQRVREADQERRWRALAKLAAEDLRAELQEAVATARDRIGRASARPPEAVAIFDATGQIVWPAPQMVTELSDEIRRERPEAVELLQEAEFLEFQKQDHARARGVYERLASMLEFETSRARLLLRSARCAIKGNDAQAARESLRGAIASYPQAASESGLSVGVSARLQLAELMQGAQRERVVRETTSDEMFVLHRLEALCPGIVGREKFERAIAAARVRSWASSAEGQDVLWVTTGTSLWAGIRVPCGEGLVAVCAVPVTPGGRRFAEIGEAGNLRFAVRNPQGWLTLALNSEFEEPVVGDIRLVAAVADPTKAHNETRSNLSLLGSFVGVLLVAMTCGFFVTLRAVNRELRLAQLKSDFVSTVSHELRTPLTSVRMFSELLQRPGVLGSEKQGEYAAHVFREAARLSQMVERILDFARIERGEHALTFQVEDVRELARRAVASFHPSRPFSFKLEVSDDPLPAKVDPGAMEEAIHNLLDNAVKYSPERAEAFVFVRPVNAHAEIEVRDEGPGVDSKDMPHLFERFYRGTSPVTLQVAGTGLGLAIVRSIAQAHGGRVRVESAAGQGSRFIIEMPLCRESS